MPLAAGVGVSPYLRRSTEGCMPACLAPGVPPSTMRAWGDGVIVGKESGQLVVHAAHDGAPFLMHGPLSLALDSPL